MKTCRALCVRVHALLVTRLNVYKDALRLVFSGCLDRLCKFLRIIVELFSDLLCLLKSFECYKRQTVKRLSRNEECYLYVQLT